MDLRLPLDLGKAKSGRSVVPYGHEVSSSSRTQKLVVTVPALSSRKKKVGPEMHPFAVPFIHRHLRERQVFKRLLAKNE